MLVTCYYWHKKEIEKKNRCLYCCWQKRHPSKTWQQRGPSAAKSHAILQVNVGQQRPALSRLGMTSAAWLQHLWVSTKGWLRLPPNPCAKTNAKKKQGFLWSSQRRSRIVLLKCQAKLLLGYCYCLCVYPQLAHPWANVTRIQVNQL